MSDRWEDELNAAFKSNEDLIVHLRAQVTEMEATIKRLREVHPPKFRHTCYEWDGMEIDEYDPEFEACTCYRDRE